MNYLLTDLKIRNNLFKKLKLTLIINLIGNNAQKNFSRHRIAWLIISNKKAMFFGHRFKKFIANRLCYFQHIQFTVA